MSISFSYLTLHEVLNFLRSLGECFSWTTLRDARRRVSIQAIVDESFPNHPSCRFDLDYPVECDDEYWETSDPGKAFQQPPGNPCKISSFVWMIKLSEIIGFALRTLYATKKSKAIIGFIGNEWESQVVAELDSSMNKWKDSLPHFCRIVVML